MKQYYFADRSPPDLCAEYDVIGFDADHCLVKYNIPKLASTLSEITSNDLFTLLGYPEEIKQVGDDYNPMSLNNTVWDIENRTLLKLGEGKLVVQANRGTTKLT